jgi:hypothetical protein
MIWPSGIHPVTVMRLMSKNTIVAYINSLFILVDLGVVPVLTWPMQCWSVETLWPCHIYNSFIPLFKKILNNPSWNDNLWNTSPDGCLEAQCPEFSSFSHAMSARPLWGLLRSPVRFIFCHHNFVNKTIFQLVPCDSINHNKVSIRQLPLFYFPSLATCFGPYGPSSGEIYNRFIFNTEKIKLFIILFIILYNILKYL